ncbi:MAG: hypothetical protein L0H93_05370 [Nocardioides sp.]|nr:hypothetical protein [Nocardioides sp.]
MQRLGPLLDDQHGIISRQQVLEVGLTENDLRRLIRTRHLVLVHPGVFAHHAGHSSRPGHLSPHQRAWAAVLYAWSSEMCHASEVGRNRRLGVALARRRAWRGLVGCRQPGRRSLT